MKPIIGKQFPLVVIPLIEKVKRNLDIVVFDWRWYPQDPGSPVQLFNQAIVRAVRRGVQVRAVANNNQIISTLRSVGVNACRQRATNLLHCKIMILDRESVILGSHNYTQNAFSVNTELSVHIYPGEDVKSYLDFFNSLFKI